MRALVLGGTGFVGRHVAAALLERGHRVVIGSRHPQPAPRRLNGALLACERRQAQMDWLTAPAAWSALLRDIDVVVNAVGILRERGFETYDRVHHRGPAALAAACAVRHVRLIHVSVLGLHPEARSRFIRSKWRGERAIAASGADYCLVRPSLLDGEDGYGARWLRRLARWPVHCVPAGAAGRIAALDVGDLSEAIAALCASMSRPDRREVELGGSANRTLAAYLAALRACHDVRPALVLEVPAWLARAASHAFDLMHFSPFSFGQFELLQRDSIPRQNRLPELLGRAPKPVGGRGAAGEPFRIPFRPAAPPGLRGAGGPAS